VLPLIHAEDTEQETPKPLTTKDTQFDSFALLSRSAQAMEHKGDQKTGVATDIPGIELCKYFRVLVEGEGGG
jgi:hypothetical protein